MPTRHGDVRSVVVSPPTVVSHPVVSGPPAPGPPAPGSVVLSPVVLQLHGGGFINRYPEQDLHIARYLAASLGATVVLPDYDTAPTARYPVAEEEVYDIACWVQAHGHALGWDSERLLLSGVSAGSKLSINICQQLHAAGAPLPLAVSLVVPFTDATRADRTSAAPHPAISPMVQRAVQWSYFSDVERRGEVLASPRLDAALPAAMPPTLIQSGAVDTLAADAEELAEVLHAAGVKVVHRQYPGADHDFYSKEPVATVRALLSEIERFFSSHLIEAG